MDSMYERIKALRIAAGMSQSELAKKTGYADRSSIAKIESGVVDISQTKIQLFADALGTTVRYLMDGEAEDSQDKSRVFLSKFMKLSESNKSIIMNLIQSLEEKQ